MDKKLSALPTSSVNRAQTKGKNIASYLFTFPAVLIEPFIFVGRIKANLQYCAEMIPTLSTQLRIIASVKASTPDDASVRLLKLLKRNFEQLD